MSTDNNIAVCPQCGATGKAGRFCEYCGTKIPMPIKKATKVKSKGPFLWISVCPQGFVPVPDYVEGKPQNGTLEYMVVEKKESRQFLETVMVDDDSSLEAALEAIRRGEKIKQHPETRTRYEDEYTYAIISREGKFVVAPSSEEITLFADNYDYIEGLSKLANIHTGIILDDLWNIKIAGDYIVYRNYYDKPWGIFNRKARTAIALDKEIPADYGYMEMDNDNLFLFTKEVADDRTLTCTVQIIGNQGIVSIDEKGEQEAKEEEEKEKRGEKEEEEKKTREREEERKKKAEDKNLSCIIRCLSFILGAILIAFIIPGLRDYVLSILYLVFRPIIPSAQLTY